MNAYITNELVAILLVAEVALWRTLSVKRFRGGGGGGGRRDHCGRNIDFQFGYKEERTATERAGESGIYGATDGRKTKL